MKSIERRADGECIGGLSGGTERDVRVVPHSDRTAKVTKRTVESTGEAHLAR